jgi:hypothetical protein
LNDVNNLRVVWTVLGDNCGSIVEESDGIYYVAPKNFGMQKLCKLLGRATVDLTVTFEYQMTIVNAALNVFLVENFSDLGSGWALRPKASLKIRVDILRDATHAGVSWFASTGLFGFPTVPCLPST